MFEMLFQPGRINNLELNSRVVMTAMHLNYTPGGKVNERLIGFYEERALGGVEFAIIGGCTVDEYSGAPDMISLKSDDDVNGLKQLTDRVHAAGGRPVQNLGEETAGVVPEIHVVGDANGPRKALDAIWEGYDVGLKL